MVRKIGRCAADDLPHLTDPYRALAGIGQMSDADGHVDAFINQVHDPINEKGADRDVRILAKKFGQNGQQKLLSEQHRCRHMQHTGRTRIGPRRRSLGFFHIGQYLAAIFKIAVPGFG